MKTDSQIRSRHSSPAVTDSPVLVADAAVQTTPIATGAAVKISLLSKSKRRLISNKELLAKKYMQRKAALVQRGKKLKKEIQISNYLKPDTSKVTYGRTPDGTGMLFYYSRFEADLM